MRLHFTLMVAVVQALKDIFGEGYKADKVLQRVLRSDKRWGKRDRAFIASNTYDVVRWWRLLHFINGSEMEDVSEHTLWQLLGIHLIRQGITVDGFEVFDSLQKVNINGRYQQAQSIRAVRESIPDWLDMMGSSQLNHQWEGELKAMNEEARVAIRTNTFKATDEELKASLGKEGVFLEEVPDCPHAFYLEDRSNVFATKAFHDGYFEIQDPGSQLIGQYLEVEPGMRVIDACAGAGGKTLLLSNLMEGKGTLIAMDVEAHKLVELKKRAKRNGAHNIDPRAITSNKTIKRLKESADRVLLDVPCSGTGVLRRNPDAKWKLDQDFMHRIQVVQQDILSKYTQMVRIGGKVVYATCSILNSENEDQVRTFLTNNNNFVLEAERRTSPAKHGFDGFYMARLIRKK